MKCANCGYECYEGSFCPQCGIAFVKANSESSEISSWPLRDKKIAIALALILGNFGIHKFYLGNFKMGIIYLAFCWIWIPGLIGMIEGIIYLFQDDETFMANNHVRIK